jgi:chitodextrinase
MTINVGDLVQFSGTASDPDGNLPLSYLWQFGQGSGVSPSTFEDPGQLQFNIPGTFAVTFTVTDALNLSDPTPATRIITVRSQSSTIPKDSWRLKSVDSEELVGENGAAENAFDGNVNTMWHTAWLATNPPQPHEIQIDLGLAYAINGFRYLPRQDNGANGRIGQYEFYVSTDGSNWGNPAASGTFANNATEKEVTIQSAVGRYIRLRSLREVNGNPWTSMAEISVLGTTPSGNQPPDGVINSPSASMTINIGDQVQFSGTGSDYDNNLPLTYLWQFGQGSGVSPSTFEDPGQLQFNIPGTFAVTFTVTDALGLPDPTPATRTITVRGGSSEESLPDWTGYNHGPFHPTDPTFITNPVLTAADVTDISAAFVADPFLFYESGTWYMFFEAYNSATRHGDIALALSSDGLHWRYDRIVLSEGFHHSFPLVFKHNGRYYMVPESFVQQQVRLYESTNFPYSWLHVATLASGRAFVDPAVFRHGNTWWMFAGDTTNSNCYLYYSDSLTNGWVEHPMSPVVRGDASKGRLGGRPFIYDNGRIVRIVQKNDSSGIAVRAFEVDKLTKTEYAEHEIPESPLLLGGNSGWNTQMHHFDPWWNGQYWICAVDGHHIGDDWSIGIYVSD